jgi:hypothetical protein
MPRASVSAPKPSMQFGLRYAGPRATAEARASLEGQLVDALGGERASDLRQWVALIGETVPWDVVEDGQTTRTFQPTEYAIGHAVRRSPADAAAQFGVCEHALGRYIVAADEVGASNPGRVASCAAGGYEFELGRLADIPGDKDQAKNVAAVWHEQYMSGLPIFGALCKVQLLDADDRNLVNVADSIGKVLWKAVHEHNWKAQPGKKNRPAERLRDLRALIERTTDETEIRWAFYNLEFGERVRIDDAACSAGLDIELGSLFFCQRAEILAATDALLAGAVTPRLHSRARDFRQAIESATAQPDIDAAWLQAPLGVRLLLDKYGLEIYRHGLGDIDREALIAAIDLATGGKKKNRHAAVIRTIAEDRLRKIYLDITGRERPNYSKRVGYAAGDGCPFEGPYVDFLKDCGRHYPVGATQSLADLLPWQLKRKRTVSVH